MVWNGCSGWYKTERNEWFKIANILENFGKWHDYLVI